MNEKIKELAKLSRLDADQIMCEILCYDYSSVDEKNLNDAWVAIPIETRYEVTEYIEQMQERFAELIIRKCAKVADIADENKCEWIGGNILTYFGVEE